MSQQQPKERIHTNPQGLLLGLPGPAWALAYLILIAAIVMISVWIIGDPNPLG